jgi:hypothetical protein
MPRTIKVGTKRPRPGNMARALHRKHHGKDYVRKIFKRKTAIISMSMPPSNEHKEAPYYYFKEVECWYLGDFGIHTLFTNKYTLFHIPTGLKFYSCNDERTAKVLIKKIDRQIKKSKNANWEPEKGNIEQYRNMSVIIQEILRQHENREPDKINPDEDIPF